MSSPLRLFGVLPLETDPNVIGAALSHDRALVGLSMLTALAFSFGFLALAGQSGKREGSVGLAWRAASGALLGLGVWATHFIGMLGLETPLLRAVPLDSGLQSLAIAIACGVVALAIAAPRAGWLRFGLAGVLIAFGALAMHYWDVLALEIDAAMRFRPQWVAATAVGAFLTAVITVPVAYALTTTAQRVLMAAPMGAVIAGLHYVDMAASVVVPSPSFAPPAMVVSDFGLAIGIAAIVVLASAMAAWAARRPPPEAANDRGGAAEPIEVTGDPIVMLPRRRGAASNSMMSPSSPKADRDPIN